MPLIPLRWKIYGLAARAFVFALMRWRSAAVDSALAEAEAQRNKQRLKAIEEAAKVRDEVEIMDDTGLADRASRWMRGNDTKW